MLEKLFASELKIKILNLFFSWPEKKYDFGELSRALNLKAVLLQRELGIFIKLGLVNSFSEKILAVEEIITENQESVKKFKKARAQKSPARPKIKTFFQINKEFFLFSEIKALLAKSQVLLSLEVFKELERDCRPRLLLLTGKFVDQSEQPTDILIVGTISRRLLLPAIHKLEQALGWEINFTILSEREFSYRQEIMDIFLYNILEGEKIILVGTLNKESAAIKTF
jgi:hypothetical protein